MSFTDKVVVVTGASSGIGKAIAQEASKRGALVAVCARKIENLEAAFGTNNNFLLCAADVSKQEDCERFNNTIIAKWGRIDVLINNAGISMRALLKDAELGVLKELMDINFWGAVYCTKFALPSVIKTKGVIASVSSIAGYRGLPGRTGYSASKFALQGFMEALRTEHLHSGVHIMWVSPGFTSSNIRNVARSANGTSQGETPLEEGKLMSAEQCATIILEAIEKRKRTVVMTLQGMLTVWLNKLFPSLTDKLVFNHFSKEQGSPLGKGS